jgi:hypothetical protein
MLPLDARARWPGELLTDSRVTHIWDNDKILGQTYAKQTDFPGMLWDAFFLYGPEVSWDDSPPKYVSWGSTIMRTRERLKTDCLKLLGKSSLNRLPSGVLGGRREQTALAQP